MPSPGFAAGIAYQDSAPAGAGGTPLLLLHGAGGTRRHWPAALAELPGRRVLSVDLPGHGQSPGPDERSVAGNAGRALALLDALGLPAVVVAGHSMGGAIALALALGAPARVAALVLVGTGARLRVTRAILEATADPAVLQQAARSMAEWSFGPGAPEAAIAELAEGIRANLPGVMHRDFLACNEFDVMARLGGIAIPTLVVCGEEDRLTPPKYAEFLRDGIPGARLERVAGAGHMVMLEAPDRVARAVRSFLEGR